MGGRDAATRPDRHILLQLQIPHLFLRITPFLVATVNAIVFSVAAPVHGDTPAVTRASELTVTALPLKVYSQMKRSKLPLKGRISHKSTKNYVKYTVKRHIVNLLVRITRV